MSWAKKKNEPWYRRLTKKKNETWLQRLTKKKNEPWYQKKENLYYAGAIGLSVVLPLVLGALGGAMAGKKSGAMAGRKSGAMAGRRVVLDCYNRPYAKRWFNYM